MNSTLKTEIGLILGREFSSSHDWMGATWEEHKKMQRCIDEIEKVIDKEVKK